jgi:hypothetical protein
MPSTAPHAPPKAKRALGVDFNLAAPLALGYWLRSGPRSLGALSVQDSVVCCAAATQPKVQERQLPAHSPRRQPCTPRQQRQWVGVGIPERRSVSVDRAPWLPRTGTARVGSLCARAPPPGPARTQGPALDSRPPALAGLFFGFVIL